MTRKHLLRSKMITTFLITSFPMPDTVTGLKQTLDLRMMR
jgi:hypothetical protein